MIRNGKFSVWGNTGQSNVKLSDYVTQMIKQWNGSPKREPAIHRHNWFEMWAPLSVDVVYLSLTYTNINSADVILGSVHVYKQTPRAEGRQV